MTGMRVRGTTVLVFAVSCCPPAQARTELEPLESALTCHTPAYHLRLRSVLLARSGGNDLQCLTLPSFEPETLLSVYRTGDGWLAEVVAPEQQIWPLALEQQKSRANTADPPYVFLAFEQGVGDRSAGASNPVPGSRPALLAGIAVQLAGYVGAAPTEREQELKKITAAMDQLASRPRTSPRRGSRTRRREGTSSARGGDRHQRARPMRHGSVPAAAQLAETPSGSRSAGAPCYVRGPVGGDAGEPRRTRRA